MELVNPAVVPRQVWSLTQLYSVDFSKSRMDVQKWVFYKRTIKVCISCSWWWSGTSAPSLVHLTESLFLCSSGSNARGEPRALEGHRVSSKSPSRVQDRDKGLKSTKAFLHLVASLFHTDFSYSTPLLLPWARFFHLPLKPKSKGNKTQSQKQHKGQDTNYYPAWKYLHNLCVASAGNGKFISNP